MFFDDLPAEIVSIIILYLNINQAGFLLSGINRKCNEIVSEHSFWINILSDYDLSHLIYNHTYTDSNNLLSLDKFVNELSWIRNLTIKNASIASFPTISFSPNRFSLFKKECHNRLINVWTKNIHQLQKHYNIIKNSIYDLYLFIRHYYDDLLRNIEYCKNNSEDETYKEHIKKLPAIKIKSYQENIHSFIDKIYQIKTIIDDIIINNKTFHLDKFRILDIEYYIPFQIVDIEQYRYIHLMEIEVSIILLNGVIKGLYRGPLKYGKPDGFGSFITSNNEYYKGLFQDGYYTGEGTLIDIDLQYIHANWCRNSVITIIDYFVIT